jgi:hypothetical protein
MQKSHLFIQDYSLCITVLSPLRARLSQWDHVVVCHGQSRVFASRFCESLAHLGLPVIVLFSNVFLINLCYIRKCEVVMHR